MPNNNATMRSPLPRQGSFLLGLFVVWQLVFLFVHNIFNFLQEQREEMRSNARTALRHFAPDWPEKKGHVWNFMEGSTKLTHRWSQATLQLEQWSLFAPGIGTECFFPALLLSDEAPPDAPVEPEDAPARYRVRGKIVLSDNEPTDMRRYLRWGNFRLRKFENALFPYLHARKDESPAETLERFRDKIKEYTKENAAMLGGYVRFRLKQKGEAPPRQLILLMRHYTLTGPDQVNFVEGPFTLPFARWQPQAGEDIEYFDPVTQRFEPLPK